MISSAKILAWILEGHLWGPDPKSRTLYLCDQGQCTLSVWTSIFSFIEWRLKLYFPYYRLVMRSKPDTVFDILRTISGI